MAQNKAHAVLVESQNLRVLMDCWEHSLSSIYQWEIGTQWEEPRWDESWRQHSVLIIAPSQHSFLGSLCPFSPTPALFIILFPYFNMEMLSTVHLQSFV